MLAVHALVMVPLLLAAGSQQQWVDIIITALPDSSCNTRHNMQFLIFKRVKVGKVNTSKNWQLAIQMVGNLLLHAQSPAIRPSARACNMLSYVVDRNSFSLMRTAHTHSRIGKVLAVFLAR
jgi:hypothetical protein